MTYSRRTSSRFGSSGFGPASALHPLDARLVLVDRLFAVDLGARGGDVGVRREHQLVDRAAELRPHRPLAGRGAEDDEDRLPHVLLEDGGRDAAVEVHRDREPKAFTEEVAIVGHGLRLKAPLDELLALAARDLRGVVDFLDHERSVTAERTREVPGPPRNHRIQRLLPSDQIILVHAQEPFRFDPFESELIVENCGVACRSTRGKAIRRLPQQR